MSLNEKVMKLWEEDEFKDFTFKFQGTGNSEVSETLIKAHRWLLAFKSPVFYKMFTVDMAESKQKEVTITSDVKVFGLFLSLFYGYKIEATEDFTTGIKCYMLCHQYMADQLMTVCSDFIVKKATSSDLEQLLDFNEVYDVPAVKGVTERILSNVTVDSAVHLIQIAAKINDDTLKNCVFEFICAKKIRVSSIPNWQLVSGTVRDELLDWFSRKVAEMETDARETNGRERQVRMKLDRMMCRTCRRRGCLDVNHY